MSHDDSSIPAADKEGNELWIATYGNVKDPSSHAPDDTVLGGTTDNSQIKNNPRRSTGSSVKHSDFNVDGINQALSVSVPVLHKGEQTAVEVRFINPGPGFIDEIRHNPNNFTWYVKPGDEGKIKISSVQTTTNPSKYGDVHDAGGYEWMGYRCRIQNIQPCGTEDDTAHIVCKFKDGFNGSLTASDGYDVELTGQVLLKKTDLNMTISAISNGNAKPDIAYDNEIDQDASGTSEIPGLFGLNRSKYNPLPARTGVGGGSLRSFNSSNCNDIVIGNEQSITCSSETLLNGITQFDVEWEKYHSGDDEWKQVLAKTNINHRYTPATPTAWGGADVGILASIYVNDLKTNRHTQNRLSVQGSNGSGKYRAIVTVKGEIDGQTFECTFSSNEVDVWIYSRIKPFTVQGQATACTGETTTLTITPQVQSRPTQGLDDDITNTYIAYELYKNDENGVPEKLDGLGLGLGREVKWKQGSDSSPFTMTVPAYEGFYSVLAGWVDGHSTGGVGDTVVGHHGFRWSEPRKTTTGEDLIPWSTKPVDTTTILGEWYYSSSYRRLVMGNGPPVNIITTSKNMYATKIDVTWDIPTAHAGRGHEMITYKIDGWKGSSYTPLGTSNPANPGTTFTKTVHGETSTDRIHRVLPDKFNRPEVQAHQLHIRVNGVFTGDMSVAAAGDTNKICEGNFQYINHMTRTCAWLKEHRIPIPAPTLRATNAKKNDVRIDWKWTNLPFAKSAPNLYYGWSPGYQALMEMENTTRTNYHRTYTKNRHSGGWSQYNEPNLKTIPGGYVGKWVDSGDWGTSHPGNINHANAVDVKYEIFTRYTDVETGHYCDSKVVFTDIHKTVDKDGVYSWTSYESEPSANKAHRGRVIALKSIESEIREGLLASEIYKYAGGIYVDNIPRLRVTGIKHPKRVPAPGKNQADSLSTVSVSLLGGDANLPTHATLGEYTMTLYREAVPGMNDSDVKYDFKAADISKNRTFTSIRKTEFSLPLKTIVWKPKSVNRNATGKKDGGGNWSASWPEFKGPTSPQKKRFVVPKGYKNYNFYDRKRRFTRE
jgi:hypothetical protein